MAVAIEEDRMPDQRQPPQPSSVPETEATARRLSRRRLIAGSGVTVAAGALGVPGPATLAQAGASAAASPVAGVSPDTFRTICQAITGADDLDDAGLEQLLGLFEADAEMAVALRELAAAGAGNGGIDTRDLPFPTLVIVTNILQFWYLGNFRNEPLANRADRFPRLVSFRALPYVTTPTVCKAFGSWATEVDLPAPG